MQFLEGSKCRKSTPIGIGDDGIHAPVAVAVGDVATVAFAQEVGVPVLALRPRADPRADPHLLQPLVHAPRVCPRPAPADGSGDAGPVPVPLTA